MADDHLFEADVNAIPLVFAVYRIRTISLTEKDFVSARDACHHTR